MRETRTNPHPKISKFVEDEDNDVTVVTTHLSKGFRWWDKTTTPTEDITDDSYNYKMYCHTPTSIPHLVLSWGEE